MSFSVDRRLVRTLADIGPRRLQRRVRYELRQRLDRRFPPWLTTAWAGASAPAPQWLPVLRSLEIQGLERRASKQPDTVTFHFLQQERELSWPVRWNDPSWPRLWQFHLHYFDWSLEWLELAMIKGQWPKQAALLQPLLDHWIEGNSPGRGDGWHSYTLSLRTRNWIWLFRLCPHLATPSRIQSLWLQLRWLQAHPEHCHGGNHWLENLTALALGGFMAGPMLMRCTAVPCGFSRMNSPPRFLLMVAMKRSASYHLLLLDRLVELACSWRSSKVNALPGLWALLRRWSPGPGPFAWKVVLHHGLTTVRRMRHHRWTK